MTPDELNQRPEVKYKTLKNQQEVTFSIFSMIPSDKQAEKYT